MPQKLSSFLLFLIIVEISFGQSEVMPRFPELDKRFKADILLIVAHPDDEIALGSYLAKAIFDEKKSVSVVYVTRGSGGGNSAGREQSSAMALIREIESRKATAEFGISNIWFLDGKDTPGQDLLASLQNWGHGKILEEVVRIIRLTRPEVIFTWLPQYAIGENHGDHQAAGVIATEAFDLAGNPTIFPHQIAAPREYFDINNFGEGLSPWQPKKLYFFSDSSHPIEAKGPKFDITEISPAKKIPYYQLAAKLQLHYLTQGYVSEMADKAIRTGKHESLIKWLSGFNLIYGKSVISSDPDEPVFQNIKPGTVSFKPVRGYVPKVKEGISLKLGGVFKFYEDFWSAHAIEHIAKLVSPEVEIATGSYFHIPLILSNNTPDSVTIDLISEKSDKWKEAAGSGRYHLSAKEIYPVQTFFFAPDKIQEEPEFIIWKAKVNGKEIGKISLKVQLSEWVLPQ